MSEKNRVSKFFKFSISNGFANTVSNDEINKWIENACKFMKENPNEQRYRISSGDSMVIAIRYDDDVEVYVCHEYSRLWFCEDKDNPRWSIANSIVEPYVREDRKG